MELVVSSFAVYKVMQALDALSPREAMPWVKILAGVALGYAAVFVLNMENKPLMGLTVATGASIVHSVLRLVTLVGDVARKRSLR